MTDGLSAASTTSEIDRKDHSHAPVIRALEAWCDHVYGAPMANGVVPGEGLDDDAVTSVHSVRMGPVLRKLLHSYDLIGRKHIPLDWLRESPAVRMAILAGIVDGDGCVTDGNTYAISMKDRAMVDGVIQLARSLGFTTEKVTSVEITDQVSGTVSPAWTVSIYGEQLPLVQTVPLYKQRPSTHLLHGHRGAAVTIEEIGVDEFFGFEVTGNGRLLMADFVVTHNVSDDRAMGGQNERSPPPPW